MTRHALVFDFGNVLVDLHYDRFYEAFEAIANIDLRQGPVPDDLNTALIRYEKGLISDDAFLWVIQQYNPGVSPRVLVDVWNSMLGSIPEHRLSMLVSLSANWRVFLLSNTNNLHIRHIRKYLSDSYGIRDFEHRFFEMVFYSHELKMRKPDTEIYRHVQNRIELSPERILFIDDRADNTEAARLSGWHAIQHDPASDIAACIHDYLKQTFN